MSLFRILLASANLSPEEAARFLRIDKDVLRRWTDGQNPPPVVLDELFTLLDRQARAAAEAIRVIEARLATNDTLAFIELGVSVDDHEAQSLGWPTASAHEAVIRRVVENLPSGLRYVIRIVPRGTTLATAAAADSH